MKKKIIDKKIIFLFLIMIGMIIFMVFYLKQEKDSEEFFLEGDQLNSRSQILENKKNKLDNFINKDADLLISELEVIFEKIAPVSYLELPLKVDSGRNSQPFRQKEEVFLEEE